MEKGEKFQRPRNKANLLRGREKIGESGYLNENCWLVKNLNYAPYKRCQYCELKFHNCLFLHYQIISLILILFLFTLSFLIEEKNSKLVVISVFTLVIVYGYFFNKSTDKLIHANFAERKAKEALEELNEKLQEKVEEQTKDIKSLLEMKSEFLKVVTHQLNTPASIIKGMASMLAEGSIRGEKREEFIKKIYLSSERLIIILDDILVAQSLVAGGEVVKISPCQIEEIIERKIIHLKPQAEMKGLKILFLKPKTPLLITLADSEMLERAIFKLIDNAILYTLPETEKKEIVVKTNVIKKENKDFIEISVQDSGIGLDEEDKKNLFKLFYRGKRATLLHPNGSGLGLFIINEFVKMHKGKVNVESEGRGKGTKFTLILPVVSEL